MNQISDKATACELQIYTLVILSMDAALLHGYFQSSVQDENKSCNSNYQAVVLNKISPAFPPGSKSNVLEQHNCSPSVLSLTSRPPLVVIAATLPLNSPLEDRSHYFALFKLRIRGWFPFHSFEVHYHMFQSAPHQYASIVPMQSGST